MSKKVWAFACEDHGHTRLLVAGFFTLLMEVCSLFGYLAN